VSKWITFESPRPSKSGKTQEWGVVVKDAPAAYLGTVKWFGRWRRYAFFPERETIFEPTCLRDLAAFCEEQTRAHRESREKP